jgi:type I restriction enzyme S subunit
VTGCSATLGDICEFKYGKSLPASLREPGDARVFGSNGPVGTHIQSLLDGPAIVVGRKGSYGEVHYSDGPLWPIDTTYYVDASSTECDLRWLHYLLKHLPLTTLNKSAAVPGLNREDAYRLPVLLPPLDQQRRIAAILDKADALRRKRKRTLELLDGLTQSIFLEMFGDPISNPQKLSKISLGNLIKVKSGDGLVAKDMAIGGKYPVYGGNGINGFHDAFMFDQPKVVLGRVGVYCGAVHVTQPSSWITDNALYVSEMKRDVSIIYLAAALSQANLNQYAGRAAQPLISGSRIYPVEILLPAIDDQKRFEDAVGRTTAMKGEMGSIKKTTDSLFSSLQHRAFSGQL